MKMRRKCRLWWPHHLSSTEPTSCHLLFGWFILSSSDSLDIVVAFALNDAAVSSIQSSLQGILHETNGSMTMSLQDKCTFSLLGHCAVDLNVNCQISKIGDEVGNQINATAGKSSSECGQDTCAEHNGQRGCGCCKLDGVLDHSGFVSSEKNNWIQLVYHSCDYITKDVRWIPKLHQMYLDGQEVSHFDLHVILYDTPTYGSHHFSMGCPCPFELVKARLKRPKWVEELHQKQPLLNLEIVILAINSANAAKLLFETHLGAKKSAVQFPIFSMCFAFAWKLLALSVASLSTLFYITLQCIHTTFGYGSQSWVYIIFAKLFSNTHKNIQIRCCQILYWPILLKHDGLRSLSCAEYAEKAALRRHLMWLGVAVDVLLGYCLGMGLLCHAESSGLWILNFANDITNSLLRTGCVWLMGDPAGFKLNTELAGVLGMMSLNAIQIWSTLWFFVGSFLIHFIKGLAISAILFGLTTSAALTIDAILLTTSHVSILHWLISNLYSGQIQSIAALWRLFRGRKWNPLRQRYDSYDYSVEQHVVGSLLFTPLLLLLPTTSVFYIFFTIMKASISSICSIIDVIISLIHATPYTKILFWLMRRKRFPSGIWFEILSCEGNQSGILVSILHSNFLNIGQIVSDHCRTVFSAVSGSFAASLASRLLTGKSIPSTLGTCRPSKMPWMFIPYKEYWCLCHDSVLACKADYQHQEFF